jgi:hypothetical protein
MTSAGGANGFGTIYEWNPGQQIFTKKKDFTGNDGSQPNGYLTLYNSKFYGVTMLGRVKCRRCNILNGIHLIISTRKRKTLAALIPA